MPKGNVILGSGDLYIKEFSMGSPMPLNADIETDINRIGSIKGGATLTDTPEIYEVIDDKGVCLKRFVTSHEVIFKSGFLTWNLETLAYLALGATVTTDATKKTRTLKIGSRGAIKQYLIRFVHTMDNGKKIRVTLVGTASNGFEISFQADSETVIDAEFKALAHDVEGNQVIIEEELETV